MLALLLALLDVPSPPTATVRTHDFATLTEQQARPLIGKRARYRVELDSPETDGSGAYAQRGPPPACPRYGFS
jgi:hypothetical protein